MQPVSKDLFALLQYPHTLKKASTNAAVFLLKTVSVDTNSYKQNLCSIKNGEVLPFTTSGRVTAVYTAQNNDIFYFETEASSSKTGKIALNKLSTGGKKNTIAHFKAQPENLVFLPDGSFLFTAPSSPFEDKSAPEKTDFEEITTLPFWENGEGYCTNKQAILYLYSNKKITVLSDVFYEIEFLRADETFTNAYFLASDKADIQSLCNNFYRICLATMQIERCSLGEDFIHENFVPINSEDVLVFGDTAAKHRMNNNSSFHLYNTKSKQYTTLENSGLHSANNLALNDIKAASPALWQCYKEHVYFISTENAQNKLKRINIQTGKISTAFHFSGDIHEFVIMQNGETLFTGITEAEPAEIYTFSLENPQGGTCQLTEFNKKINQQYSFQVPEKISAKLHDQHSIDGWVIKPHGFENGKKYPAILIIHGGPRMAFTPALCHEFQFLATNGFAVFYCNPRGSGDKGDAFADIRGKYGTVDYQDIMNFTDTVLAACPWIDDTRLGVSGGSYGGFMVNWIISHTNRFKAAATERSIANWITMATTTDIGYFFVPDQLGIKNILDHEAMWNASPLKYAKNIKTPLLVLHSDEDYRCFYAEGMQMYTTLKAMGVDTKMCIFKGENHNLSRSGRPKSRIKRLEEIAGWFKKYLL